MSAPHDVVLFELEHSTRLTGLLEVPNIDVAKLSDDSNCVRRLNLNSCDHVRRMLKVSQFLHAGALELPDSRCLICRARDDAVLGEQIERVNPCVMSIQLVAC